MRCYCHDNTSVVMITCTCCLNECLYKDVVLNFVCCSCPKISYMEADMESDRSNILCTKVDKHAGDWPSSAFLQLFHIANRCVEPKHIKRPEIRDVSFYQS